MGRAGAGYRTATQLELRQAHAEAFHPEPGVRAKLDDALDGALARLARVIGAETVSHS